MEMIKINENKLSAIFIVIALFVFINSAHGRSQSYSIKSIRVVKEYGKSVDWSEKNNLIVSAKKGYDGYYDLFVMNPDGSGERLLTHQKSGCPQRHNGNPAWHPSGEYIVFTGQNDDAEGELNRKYGIPGSGLNCNLWLTNSEGSKFWQLTYYPTKYRNAKAVIHPQFSPDGRKLFWAERVRGKKNSIWGEWELKIADFITGGNTPQLKNIKTYQPGAQHMFYESHGFSSDGSKVLFCANLEPGHPDVGLDIYELDLRTQKLKRLTETLDAWDEHSHYSPDGTKIAWMSSSGLDINWGDISGGKWKRYLKTELWIMNSDGSDKQRLTHFNTPGYAEYMGGRRCIVSDSEWSPDGKSMIVLLAYETKRGGMRSRLVMIELED
jgi:Tol biopolymer transport system component